jgi:hypothetical protein
MAAGDDHRQTGPPVMDLLASSLAAQARQAKIGQQQSNQDMDVRSRTLPLPTAVTTQSIRSSIR